MGSGLPLWAWLSRTWIGPCPAGGSRGEGRRRSVDVVSALKTKRVTGGQVLAGRLPSRSEAFEEAEQPCRRRFGRRRQVLGRAHTRCGGGASGAMPPVRRGGVSGRGAAGAGGSWAALSTSARSAHGRRPRGRPHASRAALSVPALRGDSDGAAAWRDPSAAFQRDGHRAGVRDIRALRGQSGGKMRLCWQAEKPMDLWHGDVCHGSPLVLGDKTSPVRVHALLDDASRYVPVIEAMTQEREVDMLTVMVRAVRLHGPPGALYLDNGATYRGTTLALACARMGTTLIHAKPYDAPARGKMERFWRTLREGCLDHVGSLGSLHDLNVRIWAWLDTHYHAASHGALMGGSPKAVFSATPRPTDAFDEARLRAALTVTERRRVRRDSTLPMDGEDWETDLHFLAGRLVTVGRCMVDPDEPPYIEHEKKRHPLHKVDPIKNASRPRSPSNHDAPHPARVDFDPTRTMLDVHLGRAPAARRDSEDDQ